MQVVNRLNKIQIIVRMSKAVQEITLRSISGFYKHYPESIRVL